MIMKWVRAWAALLVAVGVFGFVTRDPEGDNLGGRGFAEAMDRSKSEVSTAQTPCVDGEFRVDWPANVTRRCVANRWLRLSWDQTRLAVLSGRVLPDYARITPSVDLDSLGPDVGGGQKMSIYQSAYRWALPDNGSLTIAIRSKEVSLENDLMRFSKRWHDGARSVVHGVVYVRSGGFTDADGPTFSLTVSGERTFEIAQEISKIFADG